MGANVLLGYELATGRPVQIPLAHMVVAGQTQLSGKTTTLEALIGRSGLRAVTFVTKRAEGAFNHARRIPAYFRQYADWQSVSALLEAMLNERLKFERSWIMRACKGAQTLKDVQRNVEEAQREARRGLDENVYLVLSEYLRALVPEIERLPYSDRLELQPGVNAIDISSYSLGVQALVIRSVMEWVYKHERDTICLIPEAWEFIPQSRNSPVKMAAVQLTRKGAAAGNFVWLDSQDLAGVDKEILRQVGVWVLGVQRQEHEVKRALEAIPASTKRPKPAEIMQLGRGWFYLWHGRELRCVYVQPAWLDNDPRRAQRYAIETLPESFVAPPADWKKQVLASATSGSQETTMNNSQIMAQWNALNEFMLTEMKGELGTDESLVDGLQRLMRELKVRHDAEASGRVLRPEPLSAAVDVNTIAEQLMPKILEQLKAAPEFATLQVMAERPELQVTIVRKAIDVDGSTLRGRLAQLIAEGWFNDPRGNSEVMRELARRGFQRRRPISAKNSQHLPAWGSSRKRRPATRLLKA